MKIPKLSSLLGSAVALLAMASLTSTQASPAFVSSTPTGKVQFENSYTTYTVILSDATNTPITNVSITLTGKRLIGGVTFIRYGQWPGSLTTSFLSNSGSLTYSSFSGLALDKNVTYSAVIVATDASYTNTTTTTFDTIKPDYMWDAADYDYTLTNSDGSFQTTDTGAYKSGQHYEAPAGSYYTGPNKYRGHPASSDDAMNYYGSGSWGVTNYRPLMTNAGDRSGISTEVAKDTPRPQYYNQATNGITNYDICYHYRSNYANYTHVYPASANSYYYMFARMSSPNASQSNTVHVYDQSGQEWGWFGNVKTGAYDDTGWQGYTWVPLKDYSGSDSYVTFATWYYGYQNGGAVAQKITMKNDTSANQYNGLCYIMLDGSTPIGVPAAVITNFSPNGAYQFQNSNTLTFTVKGGSVTPAKVLVTVAMTNLNLGRTVVNSMYVGGSGSILSNTGSANNLSFSLPLQSNKMYGVTVQATDSSGNDAVAIVRFDTVSPTFLWEAEDWDYNSGLWQTNGGVNAYADFNSAPTIAVTNVDFMSKSTSTSLLFPYRYGLSTETVTDPAKRSAHTNASGYVTDYDLGNGAAGSWANYTRVFPKNMSGTTNMGFNIFARTASQTSYSDIGSLWTVTSGVGLPGAQQVTTKIGYYGSTAGADWHTGQFMPVIDGGGNLAIFKGGSSATLRYQFDGNYGNVNYFMLIPADPNVKNKPYITSFTPDGSVLYQPSNTVTFIVNSQAGVVGSNVTVNVDGTVLATSLLTCGTNQNLMTVSAPIYTNTTHLVIVTVTDAYGSSTNTNRFAVFNSNDCYRIESEDFNFNNGESLGFASDVANAYSWGKVVDAVTNVDYAGGIPLASWSAAFTYRAGQATASTTDLTEGFPAGATNFANGYNNSSTWENYTRTFAAGTYNVFLRAGGNGNSAAMGSIFTVTVYKTTTQTATSIGTLEPTPSTGSYSYSPFLWFKCTNSGGNLGKVVSDGTPVCIRRSSGGNDNANCLMVVKWNSSIPELPSISQFTPDSSTLYQPSNAATFFVNSYDTNFSPNNVSVTLDDIKLTTVTNSSKIINGQLTNGYRFGFPVSLGRLHTATVVATDQNGAVTNTYSFQTFSKTNAFKIELEDYDFNGGGPLNYIAFSNWAPNCYTDIVTTVGTVITTNRIALTNIDFMRATNNYTNYVRTNGNYRYGMVIGEPKEMASDEFTTNSSVTNYVTSYNTGGDWMNYTRDFPAGKYNVYLRFAAPGTTVVPGPQLQWVTNGVGTINQETNVIATFQSVATLGGWGNYLFTTLLDNSGKKFVWEVTNSNPQTLRFYENWPTNFNNSINPDYIVFVSEETATPVISGLYPDGSVQFQATNALGFTVSSSAGISTNDIKITINGVAVAFTVSGNSTNWTVSVSLAQNSNYVAVIEVTANGSGSPGVSKTISFDTYSTDNYTWEAEDFDYYDGNSPNQYIDNDQIGAYLGKGALEGFDFHMYGTNNEIFANQKYRATTTSDSWTPGSYWFAMRYSGDKARTQFTGATTNLNDYDIEYFTSSSWAHYTRHYREGTFYVLARVREGVGPMPIDLKKVTGTIGSGETVTTLGTFYPTNQGSFSGAWQSVMLRDSSSNLATVTFTGSNVTLRVEANTNSSNPFPVGTQGDSANLNYFMLVPTTTSTNITLTQPTVTAKVSGTTLTLSFPSQSGAYYQVESKTTVNGAWASVGNKLTGTGSKLTQTDTVSGTKFYRVVVTTQ